ncbi:MAG: class I SAM-dependent methyltransferase [Cytophagales bacterium]
MSEYKDYGYTSAQYTHIHKYLLSPLLLLLDKSRNKMILDVGCGNGWLANLLIEKGFNVYGTDASEKGIAIANLKNSNRFYMQDLAKDELPSQLQHLAFDTIISTEVIEHLYDPRKYIAFCRRVLIKNGGGELIISTPYHGYLKNIILAISGKLDDHFAALWDGGHIKFWSRKTLTAILKEHNFSVTHFIGCGRLPYV